LNALLAFQTGATEKPLYD